MPSFDIVSEVDNHELANAVDQANREISARFDFRGSDAKIDNKENVLTLSAASDFQVDQMQPVLYQKLTKRGIDISCIDPGKMETRGMRATKTLTVRQGVDSDTAKKIVKLLKDSKIKVQAAIQGDQVRVTGKKRDDLQGAIQLMKESNLDLPLQFSNFRD